MSLTKHAAFLVAFLVLSGHAQAQFKGMAEPMPAVPAAPMAVPVPVTAPDLGAATAPITSAPSVAPEVDVPTAAPAEAPGTTGAIPATTPTVMVPGCPDGPDCPPEPEGEGPFSEAVKEMLKEFAKCEAEGKSLETCLSDDPPPQNLSQLTQEDRAQLVQCLGSSDLSATKVRWSGCLVGAD
jgi:hypothetical protein